MTLSEYWGHRDDRLHTNQRNVDVLDTVARADPVRAPAVTARPHSTTASLEAAAIGEAVDRAGARRWDWRDGTDYAPYEGFEVTGWPVTTIVRDQAIGADDRLVGGRGRGLNVAHRLSDYARPGARA